MAKLEKAQHQTVSVQLAEIQALRAQNHLIRCENIQLKRAMYGPNFPAHLQIPPPVPTAAEMLLHTHGKPLRMRSIDSAYSSGGSPDQGNPAFCNSPSFGGVDGFDGTDEAMLVQMQAMDVGGNMLGFPSPQNPMMQMQNFAAALSTGGQMNTPLSNSPLSLNNHSPMLNPQMGHSPMQHMGQMPQMSQISQLQLPQGSPMQQHMGQMQQMNMQMQQMGQMPHLNNEFNINFGAGQQAQHGHPGMGGMAPQR
jgi:hypothetical protein